MDFPPRRRSDARAQVYGNGDIEGRLVLAVTTLGRTTEK